MSSKATSPSRTAAPEPATPLAPVAAALFGEINVDLEAKLGKLTLSVEDLLSLTTGQVLTLDRQFNELIDIQLNNTVIARGEIVAVGDNFAVRIVELAKTA